MEAATRTGEEGTAQLSGSTRIEDVGVTEFEGVVDFGTGNQLFTLTLPTGSEAELRFVDEELYLIPPHDPGGGGWWLRIGQREYDGMAGDFGVVPEAVLGGTWVDLQATVRMLTDAAVGFTDLGATELSEGSGHCWLLELEAGPDISDLAFVPIAAGDQMRIDTAAAATFCVDGDGHLVRLGLETVAEDTETDVSDVVSVGDFHDFGASFVIAVPSRYEDYPPTTAAATKDVAGPATPYDGLWMGTTSQGVEMGFQIEAGIVTWALLERGAPCVGIDAEPVQVSSPELGAVSNGEIHLTLGPGGDSIDGGFDSETTASGNATIDCDGPIEVTWEATRVGDVGTQIPQDDWYGAPPPADALPDYDISDHLVDNDAGPGNFNEQTPFFDTNEDWYLVGTWGKTFIPVPAGWTILESGSGVTAFLFSEERDLVLDEWGGLLVGEPEVAVVQRVIWDDPSVTSVHDALKEFDSAADDPGVRVLASELVDDVHGYLVLEARSPEGDATRTLLVFADNAGEDWIDVLVAETNVDRWVDYYPIIRAMVRGWYNVHGDRLGIDLPEAIP